MLYKKNKKDNTMQTYERIKELAVRHAQGITDEAEERELHTWLAEDQQREEMFQRLMSREAWNANLRRFVKSPEEEKETWRRILNRTVRREKRLRQRLWIQRAALFLLPLTVGAIAWWTASREDYQLEKSATPSISPGRAQAELILPQGEHIMLGEETAIIGSGIENKDHTLNYQVSAPYPKEQQESLHILRIPRGGEYTLVLADSTVVFFLVLADSTVVFLNAESKLQYPARFEGKERKVYLSGEAYFDVKANPEKPFIVTAGGMDVRVYGTEFNVTAYEGESVRTVLVEGKVGVKTTEGSEEVQLHPGQMAEREGNGIVVQEVDTYTYTAWKDGKFVFEEENIERIMERLARWYNLNVFYANESVKNQLFNGVLTRFTEVEDILRVIEQTATVEFEIKGNTVIVK